MSMLLLPQIKVNERGEEHWSEICCFLNDIDPVWTVLQLFVKANFH